MNGFIDWLKKRSDNESRVRAVLRRSLAFPPGDYPEAYPYVEPFIKGQDGDWRRKALYLIAGLWAAHAREEKGRPLFSLARAAALYRVKTDSSSAEGRFIALLDADEDQLAQRLRMIVALLKDYNLDFEALLKGIVFWNSESKTVQNQWAREYYHAIDFDDSNTATKEDPDEDLR